VKRTSQMDILKALYHLGLVSPLIILRKIVFRMFCSLGSEASFSIVTGSFSCS